MEKKTNNFDRIAPVYDQLAGLVFGRALREAQTEYLSHISASSKVLILGGGTGWLLKEVLRSAVVRQIDYIETSPKMIARAKSLLTLAESLRVNFILGDENSVPDRGGYDVVITFFILDLFKGSRLQGIFNRLDEALNPSGLWLFADFYENNSRWWHKVLMGGMYRFFRITCNVEGETLPDFGIFFQRHRFSEIAGKTFFGDFIAAKVYGRTLLVEPC